MNCNTPSEEEIFRRKLLMDGEGTGDARRIDEMYNSFMDWFNAEGQSPEEINAGYEKIIKTLENVELKSRRNFEAQELNDNTIDNLKKEYAKLESKIEIIKGEIAEKKAELSDAKSIHLKKQKCHALAQIIAKLPDRQESQSKLQLMQLEIDALASQNEDLRKKLDQREKYLATLLTSAVELKNKLRKELEEWEDSESD